MTESITPAGGTDLLTRDEVGTDNATQHQEPGHSERRRTMSMPRSWSRPPSRGPCRRPVWQGLGAEELTQGPPGLPRVRAEVYQAIRPGDNRGGKNDPASW